MPRGRIASAGSQYGRIRLDDGRELEFEMAQWISREHGVPVAFIDAEVEFEEERIRKRTRAIRVRLFGPVRSPRRHRAPPLPGLNMDFLNPYNFVRPVDEPKELDGSTPDARLMGRCPPPPHDRGVGLSGRIKCTVKTVSEVFVSDSHRVDDEGNGHFSYRFFREGSEDSDHPCIPASSLRGSIRSVFEAVTNSCWEHVEDRQLYRRYSGDASSYVPGRITKDIDGKWQFEILSGTTAYSVKGPTGEDKQYAAWVPIAGPMYSGRPTNYHRRPRPDRIGAVAHGSEDTWAHLTEMTRTKSGRTIHFWNVLRLESSKARPSPCAGAVSVVKGFLFEMGRNIGNKHDERFFFSADPHAPLPVNVPPGTASVNPRELKRYLQLLEEHRQRADRPAPPGLVVSRTIKGPLPKSLSDLEGHLCYAILTATGAEVLDFGPVSVPRQAYRHTVLARRPGISTASMRCSDWSRLDKSDTLELCPACRLFGWVARDEDKQAGTNSPHQSVAYRGRVRFGNARFDTNDLVAGPRTLPILSSPKPTTTRFYLIRSADLYSRTGVLKPANDLEAKSGKDFDYDSPDMVMRGRKMYRTHGIDARSEEKTNQNRTIRDWLDREKESCFEIRFENLAPVELGALLWAVELPERLVHRVGFGKPLGYGSIRIGVQSLELDYSTTVGTPVQAVQKSSIPALKARFEEALAVRYGYMYFSEMENVSDLTALLEVDGPGGLPVRYPRFVDKNGDFVPEGYAWFMANRGSMAYADPPPPSGGGPIRGKGYWLGIAECDAGLPNDPKR